MLWATLAVAICPRRQGWASKIYCKGIKITLVYFICGGEGAVDKTHAFGARDPGWNGLRWIEADKNKNVLSYWVDQYNWHAILGNVLSYWVDQYNWHTILEKPCFFTVYTCKSCEMAWDGKKLIKRRIMLMELKRESPGE